MYIEEAINKINCYNNFSSRLEGERILVQLHFKGSVEECGFISEKETKLEVGFCGSFTSKFKSILEEIAQFKIEWTQTEAVEKVEIEEVKDVAKAKIEAIHYSSLAERDLLESDETNWMFTHDL